MANELSKNLKNEVSAAISNTTIADSILKNFSQLVEAEQLKFPENYNVGNQLKLAYLTIIQNPDFIGCTSTSIGQALTEFALQGLEVDKKQVYFIKFGNQLKMFRSYFGDVAVAYRTELVKDIKAMVVYSGDKFETTISNDEEVVAYHKTSFVNRDNEIIGAYAVATLPDGAKRYCIMTKEIEANWNKSRSQKREVQKEFPQEMAKRTVIRRLVKMLFNTANTSDNYIAATIASYNRTTEEEYENSIENSPTPRKTTVHNSILPEANPSSEELVADPVEDVVETAEPSVESVADEVVDE